jgi:phosphoribosylglycinamide formyltransferase 1
VDRSLKFLRLGFLASRNGSSMRAIVSALDEGILNGKACVVISNNIDAPALEFASAHAIPALCVNSNTGHDTDQMMADTLQNHDANLVLLSGFMRKIGPITLQRFAGRILNIHPSLLPNFGGQGMYGNKVHQAVLAARAPITGITIHAVDGVYDHGAIIAQKQIPVLPGDTVEVLASRVRSNEPSFFVETLHRVQAGGISLPS